MKNKPFEKMTAAEKRVAIARDVIKQIKAEVYQPWIGYALIRADRINQETVKAAKECQVCAVGAAFFSSIRLGNGVDLEEAPSEVVFSVLGRWFSEPQMLEIETAYELWTHKGTQVSRAFGSKYTDKLDRMTAIFRNIIANKGTFKP